MEDKIKGKREESKIKKLDTKHETQEDIL